MFKILFFISIPMIVIYLCATTLSQVYAYLQSAFKIVQSQLYNLKPVLNAEKTFSKSKMTDDTTPSIITVQRKKIEQVQINKYLSI